MAITERDQEITRKIKGILQDFDNGQLTSDEVAARIIDLYTERPITINFSWDELTDVIDGMRGVSPEWFKAIEPVWQRMFDARKQYVATKGSHGS